MTGNVENRGRNGLNVGVTVQSANRAFPGFRCKRLKMVGLGRLSGLRPMEQTIRSSMFQCATSGAGFKGLAKRSLRFAAKRRVCLAGAGRSKGWDRRVT